GVVAIALLLLIGRDQIRSYGFTEGTFFAFIIAVFKLYDPVRKFAQFNNNFQQALGVSSTIFEFMDVEDDVKERPAAVTMLPFHKNIDFKHVHCAYEGEDGAKIVLKNINLEVKAGEVVAIVGPSGAGKSTLAMLLPRFFDVTTGALLIDGRDIRDLSISSLRAQVGLVAQEPVLFNDTVRNNLAYDQPHVSLE